MNINMANSRYLEVLGRTNIEGKLFKLKVSDGTKVADEKTSKEKASKGKNSKDSLNCSVSISEESKIMLEQSNEEKKQGESDLSSENKSSVTDSTSYKIAEGTLIHGSDKSRFIYAAYQCGDPHNSGKLDFGKLESAYKEAKKELEAQYTGEELEERLNSLNKSREDAVDDIAESVKQAINFRGKIEGKEGEARAIEVIFGENMKDINRLLDRVGVEKNQPFIDSVDTIIKFLAQKAKEASKASEAKEASKASETGKSSETSKAIEQYSQKT